MSDLDAEVKEPTDVGDDGPPIEEKPYKIIFEATACFGAGKCAEVSGNWKMDLKSGMAKPQSYFITEDDLEHNLRAAEVCPAKKDVGCIHVIDRETGDELAPDPHGDGTVSVDWEQ